jgi:exopolysaccharide biosynthesis polyprenyl glycosylphosphotransferase
MLKERARTVATGVLILDLMTVAISFLAAYWLRGSFFPRLDLLPEGLFPFDYYVPLLPLALVSSAVFLVGSGRYKSHRRVPILTEVGALIRSCIASAALFVSLLYLLRLDRVLLGNDQFSRSWILIFALLSCSLLVLERAGLRVAARIVRRSGYNYRTILIVGTDEKAKHIAQVFEHHTYWGYRVLGFIEAEAPPKNDKSRPAPIVGSLDELPQIVRRHVVDEVIFSVRRDQLGQLEHLLLDLEKQGICTRFVLNLFPETRAKLRVGELDGIPMLTFVTTSHSQFLLALKRSVDVTVATALLVVLSPVLALISILNRILSPGPVLFEQVRVGLHGRHFGLLKFRTMVPDAEKRKSELAHLNEMDGPVFKIKNDPRVTPFGRFLRKFSLDELPQFWNVLKGEMSLVGPRPPTPDETIKYKRWQTRRLSMRPGITCLWQISGRNGIDFDRWMELDLEYIDSWSPLLDFKILCRTIPAVIQGRGAS